MRYAILAAFSLVVLAAIPAFGDTQLAGYDKSDTARLDLRFTDEMMSGSITADGRTTAITDPIIKAGDGKIIGIDRGIKLLLKEVGTGKWLVLSVHDNKDRYRYLLDVVPENAVQRDLLAEQNKLVQGNGKEVMLDEKHDKVAEAEEMHQQRLNRILEQEKGSPDRESILNAYREAQKQTGPKLDKKEAEPAAKKAAEPAPDIRMEIFVGLPHSVMWKDALRFTILATDDSAHRYEPTYKAKIGNRLDGAEITGSIKGPGGETVHNFEGTTRNGEFLGSWLVPDNSDIREQYTLDARASYNDGDSTASSTGSFFVFAKKGSFYQPDDSDITDMPINGTDMSANSTDTP